MGTMNLGNRSLLTIHAEVYADHLREVMAEMERLGPPRIRVVDFGSGGGLVAIEGTHRLTAAELLGLAPEFEVLDDDERIDVSDLDADILLGEADEDGTLRALDIAYVLRGPHNGEYFVGEDGRLDVVYRHIKGDWDGPARRQPSFDELLKAASDKTTTVANHVLTSEQMEWLRAYARAVEFHDDQTVSLIMDSDYGDVTVRVPAGYALSFARMRVSEEIAVEYDEQPWEFCSPLAAERGEFWQHVTGFAPPGSDGWLTIDLGGNKALLATVECDMPEKLRITNGRMNISSVQGTMPKEIDGSLTISSLAASNLPTGATVSGTLIVERAGYRLPDGLKVGNLGLSGFGHVELGDGTEIAGDLYLEGSGIRRLPDNLKVGGNIEFSDDGEFDRPCPITELPSGLYVGGDLDLRGSMIETVPDDAVVKGTIMDRNGRRIVPLSDIDNVPTPEEIASFGNGVRIGR